MPDLNEPPEFTEALREHFARQVDRADFEPITAAGVRRAANRPTNRAGGGLRWLAVAAAAAVVIPGGIAVVHLLSRPLPAVPVPTVAASPGTVTATPRPTVSWTRRITAPVQVDQYAQATVDGTVYLVATLPQTEGCRLQGYRYHPAVDRWEPLPDGPAYQGSECVTLGAFARGTGVDVVVAGDEPRLYRYAVAGSTWKPAVVADGGTGCQPVGLAAGVFCLEPATGDAAVGYQFYDPGAGRWRRGTLDLGTGGSPTAVIAGRVGSEGSQAALVAATYAGGEVVAVTWDPATGAVSEPSSHPGTGRRLDAVQATSDGYAVLTSDDPAADTALVLDPAGGWRPVEVPLPGGPLDHERPSDAGWVPRVFPDAADRVVLGGYLYRPADASWAAVAPLPRVELGTDPHDWVGDTGVCRRVAPHNCWGLSAGELAGLLTPVDPAAITASNDQVR